MTIKLTEIYGTRYFYVSYRIDLEYLVRCISMLHSNPSSVLNAPTERFEDVIQCLRRGEELILDTADAVFTPDTQTLITTLQGTGIRVIDSALPWRDNVYRENEARLQNKMVSSPLPKFDYNTDLSSYITELSPHVLYTMNYNIEKNVQFALVTLIVLTRPSIQLAEGFLRDGLFTYVVSHLDVTSLEQYNKFIISSEEGIRLIDFAPNGVAFIQGLGMVDYAAALAKVAMIPAVFGTEVLVHESNFEILAQHSLKVLRYYKDTSPKTLEEYFGSRRIQNEH